MSSHLKMSASVEINNVIDYEEVLKRKQKKFRTEGIEVEKVNEHLFDFQEAIVKWALKKGKCALFEDTGLGKTIQQLSWADEIQKHTHAPVLILAPLAVAKQSVNEGKKFGIEVKYCRHHDDVYDGICITNYERIHLFDTSVFAGVVLDESSILKSFTGKTTNDLLDRFRETPFKLCCTATPSPNDYTELGTTAEFLGVMTRNEMLAEYFINDVTSGTGWRLKGHSEDAFYKWIGTWGMFIKHPKDLGYQAEGYDLPALNIIPITLDSEPEVGELFASYAETLSERREARKESMADRVDKVVEIVENNQGKQFLIWCDFNDESTLLTKSIVGAVEIKGSDTPEHKADAMIEFSGYAIDYLVTKPKIAGFGINWQQCHNMIFCGLSDSFEMFYQAIRRCYRFGQKKEVNVYIVISEKELNVLHNIQDKQRKHEHMVESMQSIMNDIMRAELAGGEYVEKEYMPMIEMAFL